LHRTDFSDVGKPNLTRGLHVFGLLNENALGILQQGTFEEEERAVFLKSVYQNYVTFLIRVTRFTPLEFLGQSTIKTEHSQFLKFVAPFFGFP
jgi:hypothetical protein